MVRSEEQLRVGTETAAATRVRVVKYVVTEEVQVTVPLRREEIRIEEVPIDAADAEPTRRSLAPTGTPPGRRPGARHAQPARDAAAGCPRRSCCTARSRW